MTWIVFLKEKPAAEQAIHGFFARVKRQYDVQIQKGVSPVTPVSRDTIMLLSQKPNSKHVGAAKRVLRYSRGDRRNDRVMAIIIPYLLVEKIRILLLNDLHCGTLNSI